MAETEKQTAHLTDKTESALRKRKIGLALAVSAVLLSLIALFGTFSREDGRIGIFYSSEKNGVLIFENEKNSGNVIENVRASAVRYSGDGSAACLLISKDGKYGLYYISDGKYQLVSDNVSNGFVIAYSGNAVVFNGADGDLQRFTAKNGKTEKLASDVDRFALSPDGKTVVYSVKREGREVLCINRGGGEKVIGENYIPVAVSDGGAYIYALSTLDGSLCIPGENGTVKSKLGAGIKAESLVFSADLSQAVFSDGEYTYFSADGNSRMRLTSGVGAPLLETEPAFAESSGGAKISGKDELTDLYYTSGEGEGLSLFYIAKDGIRTDIAENPKSYRATARGLVYLTSDGFIRTFKNGKTVQNASGACDMQVSSDGRYIYFTSLSGDLSVLRGTKTRLLASRTKAICITGKDRLIFILNGGDMYCSAGAALGEKIDSDVTDCYADGSAAFYSKNYDGATGLYDLYSSDGSEKFSKAAEKISKIF